jgi:protoporphyrinogen oxidase
VAVVGAGVTGLTIARRLLERGCEVSVHEAEAVGGLAAGFEFPGCDGTYLEKYYHHIFRSDEAVIKVIREHGLGADLVWRASRSGVFAEGRIWPMEGPLDLLRCVPMGGVMERLRMGFCLRELQTMEDWAPLDGICCEEFFSKRNLLGDIAGFGSHC